MRFHGVSDTGLMRKSNEDAFGVFGAGGVHLGTEGHSGAGADLVAVVSDGVGGHDAGEVASAAVVASLGAGLGQRAAAGAPTGETPAGRADVETLMAGLNAHVRGLSQGQDKRMAATATAAWFSRGRVTVAHAGDSRLYRWRGGRLEALTVDDTEAGRALASGVINEKEARQHKERHVILRAVGMDPKKFASTVAHHPVEDGDVYLLCSDGLTDGLSDTQLERGFEKLVAGDLAAFAEKLVDAGNQSSGKDNITVLLVAVEPGWVAASTRRPSAAPSARPKQSSGDTIMDAFSRSAWPLWGAVALLFLFSLLGGWQDRRARADLSATVMSLQAALAEAEATAQAREGTFGQELQELASEQRGLLSSLFDELEDLRSLAGGTHDSLEDFGRRLGRLESDLADGLEEMAGATRAVAAVRSEQAGSFEALQTQVEAEIEEMNQRFAEVRRLSGAVRALSHALEDSAPEAAPTEVLASADGSLAGDLAVSGEPDPADDTTPEVLATDDADSPQNGNGG